MKKIQEKKIERQKDKIAGKKERKKKVRKRTVIDVKGTKIKYKTEICFFFL